MDESAPPTVDADTFACHVYPVLARDCGFPACHGTNERAFQVFAPGRTRLSPDVSLTAAATQDELDQTLARTRSMLAGARTPEQSLLLRKPLEVESGGAGHMGRDWAGRDVYADQEAPGYVVIERWARGRIAPCE